MYRIQHIAVALAIAFTRPGYAQPQTTIVKFAPEATADQISQFKAGRKADEIAKLGDGSTYVFRFPDAASASVLPNALVTMAHAVTGSFHNIFQAASVDAAADAASGVSEQVTRLAHDPRTEKVTVVKLNAGQFSLDILRDAIVLAADPGQANVPVKLNIVEGLNIDAYKTTSVQTGPSTFRWSATLRASVPASAAADVAGAAVSTGDAQLSISGDRITGRVVIGSDVYRIDPLAGGLHAIVKVNQKRFPPEHPYEPEYKPAPAPKPNGDAKPPKADAGIPVVGIGIVYSATAAAKIGSDKLDSFAASLVDSVNGAFDRSGIIGTVKLRGVSTFDFTEDDFDSVLARFRDKTPTSAPYVDVKGWKAHASAQVLMVITSMDAYCGLSSHILANDSPAVAIVDVDCALDNLSFAHELGHLLGARHNPEIDGTAVPYAFGHGRLFASMRSIMSYAGPPCAETCPRIGFYVGPHVKFNGQVLGNADQYDDERAISESLPTVAQLAP